MPTCATLGVRGVPHPLTIAVHEYGRCASMLVMMRSKLVAGIGPARRNWMLIRINCLPLSAECGLSSNTLTMALSLPSHGRLTVRCRHGGPIPPHASYAAVHLDLIKHSGADPNGAAANRASTQVVALMPSQCNAPPSWFCCGEETFCAISEAAPCAWICWVARLTRARCLGQHY